MPQIRKRERQQWALFLDASGQRIRHNSVCARCRNDCKQSWRAQLCRCPKFSKVSPEKRPVSR